MLPLLLSQAALASRILVSSARTSYLSNSKWISRSSGTAVNSLVATRAVGEAPAASPPAPVVAPLEAAAAAPPRVPAPVVASDVTAAGCPPVIDGAEALLGAGADAWVVAGRLAQPAKATDRTSNVTTTALQPRLTMIPPFALTARLGAKSSYHGNRGDHDGLVLSSVPCVTGVCSDPSASIE